MQYFWNNLENYGENIALMTENETLSYKEFSRIADTIAENIPTRSLVFLVCKNKTASVAGYMAFLRKRIVTALLPASIDSEEFDKLVNIYKPQYIWCPQDFSEETADWCYGEYKLISTGFDSPKMNDELAVLISTSGSTGSPKFVRLSYQNLQANSESIVSFLDITSEDKAITTLPMNYVYGLSIIQTHLMTGAGIVLTEKSIFEKSFWDTFKKTGATTFGTIPYTCQMLDKLRFLNLDLPSLRYITQAGGKLGKELHQKIGREMLDKGKKLVVMYGASEATARMSYLPWEKCIEKAGSVGNAIPGGRFELIDSDGAVISEDGIVGELVYYGPNVMQGYAQSREDLDKGDELKGRLMTGDLAKRDKDGFYYVVGRKSRFIKMLGNRVNLSDIEEMLSEKGYEVACAGGDEHFTIYTTSEQCEKIIECVKKKTGLNPMGFSVVSIKEIPRNQAGKILYSELS